MTKGQIDEWLKDHLVCPRDHRPLSWEVDSLRCPDGHHYPIVDGIPVLLLDDVRPTHPGRFAETLEERSSHSTEPPALSEDEVDPEVLQIVANTCGHMYKIVGRKLPRYPIPDIRLPECSEQVLLDIGCGWGRWCISAARKGYLPVGIDPSLERMRIARRVARQLNLKAAFLVADGRYLPFNEESFDVVFSYSVLQHFSKEDTKCCLSQIRNVLKKRTGSSLIQLPTIWGVRNLYNQCKQKFKKLPPYMMRYWSHSQLQETFSSLIGPTTISVDGFFTTDAQMTDLDLLPLRYRMVVRCSESLRQAAEVAKWLRYFADSVYLRSTRDT